ncbi:MAG: hypothetical protein GWN00_07555 [Aliifodinibius sp.]|nr:hypothetical protein [Fodinibius sp.]NIW44242.1 hypothetical protein [Gammaproteobacteria bacterium]NIX55399.1 hypothetical protein [candidate division Zixibacteria bacterium]NIY24668.1 hypothetical protein [Fodinibius sp.]
MAGTSTSGNLGSSVKDLESNLTRMSWYRSWGQDGEQTADIVRNTVSGDNPAYAIPGSETPTPGLTGKAVVVSDYSEEFRLLLGEEHPSGSKVFEFIDLEVVLSDHITWDGIRWAVDRVNYDPETVISTVSAHRED